MNQNHEIKIGRRSLRNKSSNDPAPPSTQKTNENELNIQNNPDNNQNNQINPKIEINQELSPNEPSNSVISSENRNTLNNVEIQNPTISNNIVNNNNVYNNNANQFQPVPVQMNPMMGNKVYYPNTVIVVRPYNPNPQIAYVNTYYPYNTYCSYCGIPVTTLPDISLNVLCCCFWTLLSLCTYLIGLCCYLCWKRGDFCCYEANHKCPYCKKTIAVRRYSCGYGCCDCD